MIRQGFPKELRKPAAFLFSGELSAYDREVVTRVEDLRAELLSRGTETIEDYSQGLADAGEPRRGLQTRAKDTRTLEHIANVSSVTQRWGTFLYLCADAVEAKTILELGTCAGISGCYLAAAQSCERFVTIEASPGPAKLAQLNLSRISDHTTVTNALFEEGLDEILGVPGDRFDMVYVDGHHEKIPTLRYFERLREHLNPGALVVFDDIYWSRDMYEAWEMLRSWPGFSHTLDAERFGLGVWSDQADAMPRMWSLAISRSLRFIRWFLRPHTEATPFLSIAAT